MLHAKSQIEVNIGARKLLFMNQDDEILMLGNLTWKTFPK